MTAYQHSLEKTCANTLNIVRLHARKHQNIATSSALSDNKHSISTQYQNDIYKHIYYTFSIAVRPAVKRFNIIKIRFKYQFDFTVEF